LKSNKVVYRVEVKNFFKQSSILIAIEIHTKKFEQRIYNFSFAGVTLVAKTKKNITFIFCDVLKGKNQEVHLQVVSFIDKIKSTLGHHAQGVKDLRLNSEIITFVTGNLKQKEKLTHDGCKITIVADILWDSTQQSVRLSQPHRSLFLLLFRQHVRPEIIKSN